jgi:hypothetical protein
MDIMQYTLQAVVWLSYGEEPLAEEEESIHLLYLMLPCHYFLIVGVAGYLGAGLVHHCHPPDE